MPVEMIQYSPIPFHYESTPIPICLYHYLANGGTIHLYETLWAPTILVVVGFDDKSSPIAYADLVATSADDILRRSSCHLFELVLLELGTILFLSCSMRHILRDNFCADFLFAPTAHDFVCATVADYTPLVAPRWTAPYSSARTPTSSGIDSRWLLIVHDANALAFGILQIRAIAHDRLGTLPSCRRTHHLGSSV